MVSIKPCDHPIGASGGSYVAWKCLKKNLCPNKSYCWWFRNPANQLRLVVYRIIYRMLYIPGGYPDFSHQNMRRFRRCLQSSRGFWQLSDSQGLLLRWVQMDKIDDVNPKKKKRNLQKITRGNFKNLHFLRVTTHILGPKTLIFHSFGVPRQLHRWTPCGSMERDQTVPLFRAKEHYFFLYWIPETNKHHNQKHQQHHNRVPGGIRLVLQRGSESNDFPYLGRFGCRRDPDSFLGGMKHQWLCVVRLMYRNECTCRHYFDWLATIYIHRL